MGMRWRAGVSVTPARMPLTVMPWGISSRASCRMWASRAALAARDRAVGRHREGGALAGHRVQPAAVAEQAGMEQVAHPVDSEWAITSTVISICLRDSVLGRSSTW